MPDERGPTPEEIEEACEELRKVLDEPDTPEMMRVTHVYDQFGAKLRDMTAEEREKVATKLSNAPENNMSLGDARNWIGRLAGLCDPGDAQYGHEEE